MLRFFGKNPRRKFVRQVPNRAVSHVITKEEPKKEEVNYDNIEHINKTTIVEELKIDENKETKTEKEMADERLEKIEKIIGAKAPKRKVKRVKKETGLIERTEGSAILLTEDNKMVLND